MPNVNNQAQSIFLSGKADGLYKTLIFSHHFLTQPLTYPQLLLIYDYR